MSVPRLSQTSLTICQIELRARTDVCPDASISALLFGKIQFTQLPSPVVRYGQLYTKRCGHQIINALTHIMKRLAIFWSYDIPFWCVFSDRSSTCSSHHHFVYTVSRSFWGRTFTCVNSDAFVTNTHTITNCKRTVARVCNLARKRGCLSKTCRSCSVRRWLLSL